MKQSEQPETVLPNRHSDHCSRGNAAHRIECSPHRSGGHDGHSTDVDSGGEGSADPRQGILIGSNPIATKNTVLAAIAASVTMRPSQTRTGWAGSVQKPAEHVVPALLLESDGAGTGTWDGFYQGKRGHDDRPSEIETGEWAVYAL